MLGAWLEGHWAGLPAGDVQRMPGVFLLVNGGIEKAHRHKLVSGRANYLALATVSRAIPGSRLALTRGLPQDMGCNPKQSGHQ
jgi:hypothetical protein